MTARILDPPTEPATDLTFGTDLFREFYHLDHRPTFVLDLYHPQQSIIYRNDPFEAILGLEAIDHPATLPVRDFSSWVHTSQPSGARYIFDDLVWSSTILRSRWKVVSGCYTDSVNRQHNKTSALTFKQNGKIEQESKRPLRTAAGGAISKQFSQVIGRSHDFTSHGNLDSNTAHKALMRDWDWSKTMFGPMEDWPQSLRMMANLAMTDSQPAVVFWGPQRLCLYNEPYSTLIGDRHPHAIGQPLDKVFPEILSNERAAAMFDTIWTRGHDEGRATVMEDETFFMRDGDRLLERIFSGCFYPIIGEEGEVVGFWENVKEVTQQRVEQRRGVMLRRIGELTAGEEESSRFYQHIALALSENVHDVPFAIFYAVPTSDQTAYPGLTDVAFSEAVASNRLQLVGHIGLQVDPRNTAPSAHALLCNNREIDQAVKRLQKGADPVFVNIAGNQELVEALRQQATNDGKQRGFDDDPDTIAVCAIIPTNLKQGLSGVLIIGLNSRQPYDAAYTIWLRTLARGISAALATTLLVSRQREIVEEAHRQRSEAVTEQERAQAAIEITSVGVFIMTPEGDMQYANSAWREITGFYDEFDGHNWSVAVMPQDQPQMNQMWAQAIERGRAEVEEIRLAKPWHGVDDQGRAIIGETWVKSGVHCREFGGKKVVMGSLTDISRLRWAEYQQIKLKDEALERRRQQENFIDMTSHEMRNPLSAVFQCADAIVTGLESYLNKHSTGSVSSSAGAGRTVVPQDDDTLASCVDLARTVTLCAQHQKRIVDDVLVLSKVDANLIEITPIEVQPRILVQNVVKMFSTELASVKATMEFEAEPSFDKLAVNWVKLDPGRVLQILINLCTNALKFTAEAKQRSIKLRLGASLERPTTSSEGVQYLDEEHTSTLADPTSNPDWGDGQQLYLRIQVTDTGKGMNAEELKLLFQRFQQASPRTHTQYGGSGLGLYIARLLSRLQGGEIGVTSKPDVGSTFAFFIKVRQCEPPAGVGPVKAAMVQSLPIKVSSEGPDSITKAPPKSISSTDLSILIVEDNLVNQRVLSKQLKNIGFKVNVANHGQECLDLLQRSQRWIAPATIDPEKRQESRPHTVDLILMDVEMPVMNGMTATRYIRDFEQKDSKMEGHVPIIAITGNARHEQVQEAIDAGMDGVLRKPFRVQELLTELEGFVGPIEVSSGK